MNISIHFGVNKYNPAVYGSDATLNGCVNDATDLYEVARTLGYEDRSLILDNGATKAKFSEKIREAAAKAKEGDTVLITYSCHGTQVRDRTGEEKDKLDEAICLYDGIVLDDEFVALLSLFATGVFVNVIADTCHSQDQVRGLLQIDASAKPKFIKVREAFIPEKESVSGKVKASVIQYAACKSSEVAWDLGENGAFTRGILLTLKDKKERKPLSFLRDVSRRTDKRQTPQLTYNGTIRSHRLHPALHVQKR